MPGPFDWLEAALALYKPGRPQAEQEKIPGYWAADNIAENPIKGLLGLPFGVLGSGMEKFTEEVPNRLLSSVATPLEMFDDPAALKTGGPFGALTDPLFDIAASQKKNRQGPYQGYDVGLMNKAVAETGLGALPLQMAADPTTFMKMPRAITQGVDKAGKMFGKLGELVNTRGLTKGLLATAPESTGQTVARDAWNAYQGIDEGVRKTIHMPIKDVGRYSAPRYNDSGRVNLNKMFKTLQDEYTNLEEWIYASDLAPEQQYSATVGLNMLHTRLNQTRGLYESGLGQSLKSGDDLARLEAESAYQAVFDDTMQQFDVLKAELPPRPKVKGEGALFTRVAQAKKNVKELNKLLPSPHSDTPNQLTLDQAPVAELPDAMFNRLLKGLTEPALGNMRKLIKDASDQANQIRKGYGDISPGTPQHQLMTSHINNLYRERDVQVLNVHTQMMEGLEELFRQHKGTWGDEFVKTTKERVVNNYLDRSGSDILSSVGGPGLGGLMSTKHVAALDKMMPILGPEMGKVQGDRGKLARLISEGVGLKPTGTARQTSLGEAWVELQARAEAVGKTLPELGMASSDELQSTLTDLTRQGVFNPKTSIDIQNVLKKYTDRGDLLLGDPMELGLGMSEFKYAKSQGARTSDNWSGSMRDLAKGWTDLKQFQREGWLANPAFLGANLVSALGMNLFNSPEAAKLGIQYAGENWQKFRLAQKNPGAFTPKELAPAPLRQRVLDPFEINDIRELTGGWMSANLNAAATFMKSQTAKYSGPVRAGLNVAMSGGLDPISLGGALAVSIGGPKMVQLARTASQAIEAGVRMGMFEPIFLQTIEAGYKNAAGELIKLHGQKYGPSAVSALYNGVVDAKGALGPRAVAKLAIDAGYDQADALVLGRKWADFVQSAIDVGVDDVMKWHVDYAKFTNLEQFLDQVVPFTRWPIHMAPRMAEIAASSPAVTMFFNKLNNLTQEEVKELGLEGTKYAGSIDAGTLGKDAARVFLDPSRVLQPWRSYTRGLDQIPFSQGPVEGVVDAMPFQLYPQVQLPIQAISTALGTAMPGGRGFLPYSPEAPLPSFSRIGGATGVANLIPGLPASDPEGIWKGLYKRIVPGANPFDYTEYETQKRLGEMGVEDTGFADHPSYRASRYVKDDRYNEAKRQVTAERGLEQTFGLLTPLSASIARPSEMEVLKAKRNLPKGERSTPEAQSRYADALEQNTWAAAHQGAQGSELATEVQWAFEVFKNPAVLFPDMNPTVAARLGKELAAYDDALPAQKKSLKLDPLVGLALQKRQQMIQSRPILGDYLFWRDQLHPQARTQGEDSLMAQFIRWLQMGKPGNQR